MYHAHSRKNTQLLVQQSVSHALNHDSTVRLQAGDDLTVRLLLEEDDLNRCEIRRRPVAIAPLIVRLLLEDDLKLLCAS